MKQDAIEIQEQIINTITKYISELDKPNIKFHSEPLFNSMSIKFRLSFTDKEEPLNGPSMVIPAWFMEESSFGTLRAAMEDFFKKSIDEYLKMTFELDPFQEEVNRIINKI